MDSKYENGDTPLHTASGSGFIRLQSIIDKGANMNAKDNYGNTALHIASGCQLIKYKKILPYPCTNPGITHKNRIIEILLKNKANPNIKNNNGHTPLHIATILNYVDGVRLLLKYDADISLVSNEGKTALQYAVIYKHKEIIEFLKEKIGSMLTR